MINKDDPIYIKKKNLYTIYRSKQTDRQKYEQLINEFNHLDQADKIILINSLKYDLSTNPSGLYRIVTMETALLSLLLSVLFQSSQSEPNILAAAFIIIFGYFLYILITLASTLIDNFEKKKITFVLNAITSKIEFPQTVEKSEINSIPVEGSDITKSEVNSTPVKDSNITEPEDN